MATEILNAQIVSTKLGEDHSCLTAYIYLEGDGWGCCYGGYCLDHWCKGIGEHNSFDGYGAIIELMKALEVESWEQLKGKYVRVETTGWGGNITRIGHLMKDKWFSFKEYVEMVQEMRAVESDKE